MVSGQHNFPLVFKVSLLCILKQTENMFIAYNFEDPLRKLLPLSQVMKNLTLIHIFPAFESN